MIIKKYIKEKEHTDKEINLRKMMESMRSSKI